MASRKGSQTSGPSTLPSAGPVSYLNARSKRIRVAYEVGAVVLFAGATYSFLRAWLLKEELRISLGLILVGFGLALLYEVRAIDGITPSSLPIARLVAGLFLRHPFPCWLIMSLTCVVAGALTVHFTHIGQFEPLPILLALIAFIVGALADQFRIFRLLL